MSENTENNQVVTVDQVEAIFKSGDSTAINKAVTLAMQTEQGRTILNNHLKTSGEDLKKSSYNEGAGSAYGNVDKALQDLGVSLPEGVTKTTDKVVHAIKALQTQLKDKGNTTAETEALQAKLSAVEEAFTSKELEYQTKLEKLVNDNAINELNSIKLDFDPTQNEFAVNAAKKAVFDMLIHNKKIVDGKTIYYDNEGKPFLNPNTRDYATAEEIAKEKLAPILLKSNAGGAADSKTKGNGTIKKGVPQLDASKFNTRLTFKTELDRVCQLQGIVIGSEQYNNIYDAGMKQYNVSGMPEF